MFRNTAKRVRSTDIQALESRVLFAAATPDDGFVITDPQAGDPPTNYIDTPLLRDSTVADVAAKLTASATAGRVLAVRVDEPLTATGLAVFDEFAVKYVFADFTTTTDIAKTKTLAGQIVASSQSSGAFVGNFNVYPNSFADPTRPATVSSDAPRFAVVPANATEYADSRSGTSSQMANEALWPGSPDYRNPAAGNSNAPNIRSALFMLPIQRATLTELGLRGISTPPTDATGFNQEGRFDGTENVHIPNVTRFNNFGNSSLDSDGDPATGYQFVQNAATPSNGQLPSRGDFQAQILHYRMRGALSVNLQNNTAEGGSVIGYSEAQTASDIKAGFGQSSVVNGIFNREKYALANLTNTVGDTGGTSGDDAPRSTEVAGVVWSGVYDSGITQGNSRRLAILMSNLSAVEKTIDLPDAFGGFPTYNVSSAESDSPEHDDYTVGAGQHKLLTFTLVKPNADEPTQWLLDSSSFVFLDNNRNGIGVGTPGGVTTVIDDAPPTPPALPTISINDVAKSEGDSGTKLMTFTVTRSGNTDSASTVHFATSNSSAGEGDYVVTSGTVSFASGETSKPINITIKGDTKVESDETFRVNLSSPTDATISDAQGVGTIVNDDNAAPIKPTINIADVSVSEGNSGTKQLTFTVRLDKSSSQAITVKYKSSNQTAGEGDYNAVNGTLTFSAGQTMKTFSVTIKGDTKKEGDESFRIDLSSAVNATILDPVAIGTIRNDD